MGHALPRRTRSLLGRYDVTKVARVASCGRLGVMTAKPAPREDEWWNALCWVGAKHMQLARFQDGIDRGVHVEG